MKQLVRFGIVWLVCMVVCVAGSTLKAEEDEEITNKEGDTSVISESERIGDDTVIKGYREETSPVVDEVRDDIEEWQEERDADEGMD